MWLVCHQLLEQVVSCSGLLRGPGLLEEETLTWFQFLGYLQRHGVRDLEEHLAQLAKEGRGHSPGRALCFPSCCSSGTQI